MNDNLVEFRSKRLVLSSEIKKKTINQSTLKYYYHTNIINAKLCLFVCFSVNQADTSKRILMEIDILTGHELT